MKEEAVRELVRAAKEDELRSLIKHYRRGLLRIMQAKAAKPERLRLLAENCLKHGHKRKDVITLNGRDKSLLCRLDSLLRQGFIIEPISPEELSDIRSLIQKFGDDLPGAIKTATDWAALRRVEETQMKNDKQSRPCLGCDRGESTVTAPVTPDHLRVAHGTAIHSSGMLCTRTMSDDMWEIHQMMLAKRQGGQS
jgi:hypothetical protein